jgi:hypothetical protein
MTPEEKVAIRQKMTEIDVADAEDDECAQPSPDHMKLTRNYNIFFIVHQLQSINNKFLWCLLGWPAILLRVTKSRPLEIVLMLASLGESDQTTTHIVCR